MKFSRHITIYFLCDTILFGRRFEPAYIRHYRRNISVLISEQIIKRSIHNFQRYFMKKSYLGIVREEQLKSYMLSLELCENLDLCGHDNQGTCIQYFL